MTRVRDVTPSERQPSTVFAASLPELRLQVLIQPFLGPLDGRTLSVQGELLIGRDSAADLTLEGALISRRHAFVRAVDGGLEIEDISSHGTLVDGVTLWRARLRVAPECTLYVGCVRLWLRRVLPEPALPCALPSRSA